VACRNTGNMSQALNYMHEALKIYEENGSKENIGVCYNNIGQVHNDIGDRQKAMDYFEKSLKLVSEFGSREEVAHVTCNLGYMYFLDGEQRQAMTMFERSLGLASEIGERDLEALTLNRIGQVYMQRLLPDTALVFFERSRKVYESIRDARGLALVYTSLGEYYAAKEEKGQALENFNKALNLSTKLGLVKRIEQAALGLKEVHRKNGNHQAALKMHELYTQMHDSTNNERNRKLALQKQLEHDYEKRELLAKAELERTLRLLEQKQQFFTVISVVLVVLLIVLLLVFYFRRKFVQEKESKITQIALRQKLQQEVSEKESIAHSIMRIQEEEREKLAAELHDGVNQLLFAAKMQLHAAKSTNDTVYADAVKMVESAIEEIRSIAGNQGSYILRGKQLGEALTDLALGLKGNKRIEVLFCNYGLNETILNTYQKTIILRIIQELLTNAVKHSGGQNCYILIKTIRNKVVFSVSDNGRGYKPTDIHGGNGLKNIRNKIALMHGKQRYFCIEQKGTLVYVELPITGT